MKPAMLLSSTLVASLLASSISLTLHAQEPQGVPTPSAGPIATPAPPAVAPVAPAPAMLAPGAAAAPAPLPPPNAGPDAFAKAILEARDPSTAVQVYVAAQVSAAGDLRIEQAYVNRMVQFGLPEMAESQALDVEHRVPTDGVAWAVGAYMSAKRDQLESSISEINFAVRAAPDDAFVQRTAGQILALYDTRANRTPMPRELQGPLTDVRTALKDKPLYTQAYARATAEYQRMSAAQSGQQPLPQPDTGAPAIPQTLVQQQPVDTGVTYLPQQPASLTYGPLSYYNAPYYPYSYNPYDYYPYPYGYYDYWWPSFFGGVIISNNHLDRDDRHFDRDDHHFDDHRFEGGRSDHSDRATIVGADRTHWSGTTRADPSVGSTRTEANINRGTTTINRNNVTVTPSQTSRVGAANTSSWLIPQRSGTAFSPSVAPQRSVNTFSAPAARSSSLSAPVIRSSGAGSGSFRSSAPASSFHSAGGSGGGFHGGGGGGGHHR